MILPTRPFTRRKLTVLATYTLDYGEAFDTDVFEGLGLSIYLNTFYAPGDIDHETTGWKVGNYNDKVMMNVVPTIETGAFPWDYEIILRRAGMYVGKTTRASRLRDENNGKLEENQVCACQSYRNLRAASRQSYRRACQSYSNLRAASHQSPRRACQYRTSAPRPANRPPRRQSTVTSAPRPANRTVAPANRTATSAPRPANRTVWPANRTVTSAPRPTNRTAAPTNRTVTSAPRPTNRTVAPTNRTVTSCAVTRQSYRYACSERKCPDHPVRAWLHPQRLTRATRQPAQPQRREAEPMSADPERSVQDSQRMRLVGWEQPAGSGVKPCGVHRWRRQNQSVARTPGRESPLMAANSPASGNSTASPAAEQWSKRFRHGYQTRTERFREATRGPEPTRNGSDLTRSRPSPWIQRKFQVARSALGGERRGNVSRGIPEPPVISGADAPPTRRARSWRRDAILGDLAPLAYPRGGIYIEDTLGEYATINDNIATSLDTPLYADTASLPSDSDTASPPSDSASASTPSDADDRNYVGGTPGKEPVLDERDTSEGSSDGDDDASPSAQVRDPERRRRRLAVIERRRPFAAHPADPALPVPPSSDHAPLPWPICSPPTNCACLSSTMRDTRKT